MLQTLLEKIRRIKRNFRDLWSVEEESPSSLYLFWGIILALGAPLGWFVTERIWGLWAPPPYREVLYIYITLGTSLAFTIFAGITIARLERESKLVKELSMSRAELERREEMACHELEVTKERMLKISQLGALIGKSIKEEEVYYKLAHAAHVALNFDRVLVFQRKEKGLVIVEARGIKMEGEGEERILENLVIPCSSEGGAVGVACYENRALIFAGDDYIPPKYRLKPPYSEIKAIRSRSFLLVPVKVEGERYARAIVAADRKYKKEDVNSDDLVFLEILADIASTTLARLQLERRLEVLATTDGLTGLFNRRTWMEMAEQEFMRAQRYKYSFSIIMLDIDDFKKVNDNWGHQAGDRVLKTIGAILRKNSRKVDLLGRYGGEEFVVLLPHTPGTEAVNVAQRMRRAIEKANMDIPSVVTATFGVAWFDPAHPDPNLDSVLLRADRALYQGKRMGKNRVVSSWEIGLEGGREDGSQGKDLSPGWSSEYGRDPGGGPKSCS